MIQFVDGNGNRRTIRLGKVHLEPAKEFKRKVESLLSHTITGTPLDVQTSTWLARLPDTMYEKLVTVDLAQPRNPEPVSPTLDEWLTKYIGQRKSELKPASIAKLERTATLLRDHLGKIVRLNEITPDTAHDWCAWLRTQGINDATAGTHVRNVKAVYLAAIKRELTTKNPFEDLKGTVIASNNTRYVTPDEADKIVEDCLDIRWRLLFGLARYAGLRVPSETHILTWGDVDWEGAKLSVYSPKTERYEKHRRRTTPITPKLMTILQDAFDDAETGQEHVVSLSRKSAPEHDSYPQTS